MQIVCNIFGKICIKCKMHDNFIIFHFDLDKQAEWEYDT